MIDLNRNRIVKCCRGFNLDNQRCEAGFSLIEMLIVMGLLAILMTIATIQMKSWMDRYDAEIQIKEIYADLMNARTRAMQKNRIVFVILGSGQYSIYEDTDPVPDGDGLLDTTKDTPVLQKTTQFAITHNLGSGAFQLSFGAAGLATLATNPGWLRITTSESPEYNCILISSTRINMGRFDGTNCTAK